MDAKRRRMGATIMDLPNEILIKIVKVIKDNHLITLSSINNRFRTLIFETREFNDRLVLVFKDNQWRNSDKIQAFKQMAANGRKFNQIEILNIESTTDFHRKGFNEIKDLFKDFFKNPDHVKSLTINNCKYVEWMDMMHFLNFFPRLEIVEMGENKFWNEAMSYPDAALWRRMYRSFAMESFPLASSNAPAFEHLKVLRLYNRPSFQYTNIFQNAINLEDLETDCSQCFFVFRFNNLKRLKIQITQLSDNFFSDLVLDKIQFSLTHFSVGGNFEYKRVAFKDNISLFLVRQQNITDLTFEMKEIPDLVLLDIVKLPNLKRLKMRTVVEAVPDRREFLYEWQDEGPGRLFEDIFTVKNLITEELELYWRDDNTSLKFINLFPNCKKLHLSLVRSLACAESASFVVEFPLLHKLQEVSLGLNIKSPDFNFSNIQIGPTLHKCELNYDFQSKPNPLSVAKFVENNPNIRVMILIRGFVPEILSVLTRGLKNLTYLQILSPALIVMSQENANDICDCLSLKDIELDHVPETMLKQLTKRFHRDAGRPKQDLYVAKIQEGFPLFHIKVFKDAAASK